MNVSRNGRAIADRCVPKHRRKTGREAAVRSLVVLVALLVASVPSSAEISSYLVDTGPLRIRDQFALGMGFLAFDSVSADVLLRCEELTRSREAPRA